MKKILSVILVVVMLCSTFAGLQILPSAKSLPVKAQSEENIKAESLEKADDIITPEDIEKDLPEKPSEPELPEVEDVPPPEQAQEIEIIPDEGADVSYPSIVLPISGMCGENVNYFYNIATGELTIDGSGAMYDYESAKSPFYNQQDITKITINGSITKIGAYAFQNCTAIEQVTIPDSTKTIGTSAFSFCNNLSKVIIPASVEEMGYSVFYGCSKLKTAGTIGSGCNIEFGWKTAIPDKAFYYCELEQITIPSGIKTIGENAFYHCKLEQVTIPSGTKTIGTSAFYDCENLNKVIIPASVEEVGNDVFYGRSKLKTAGAIGSGCNIEFGWKTAIPDKVFNDCSSLEQVTIPNGIKTIGTSAFSFCNNLSKVIIPASVEEMGYSVFYGCSKLKTAGATGSVCNIEFGWKTAIPDKAFYSCELEQITIPNGIELIGAYAFSYCKLEQVTIPSGIKTIGAYAFSYCRLEQVTILNGVKTIGEYAFSHCENINKVIIPESVEDVDYCVFYACPKLRTAGATGSGCNIEFGWKNTIPGKAFYCSELEQVIIPNGIKRIGGLAFGRCRSLSKLIMPETVIYISGQVLFDCPKLKTAGPIGSGCDYEFAWTKFLPPRAFSELENLKSVIFPEGLEQIGDQAFRKCESLAGKIEVPESVTYIGDSAFSCCTGLSKLVLKSINPVLGGRMFAGCSQFESAGPIGSGCDIEFAWKLSSLTYNSAFAYMQGLKTLIIPEGVNVIDNELFRECDLDSLYLPNSLEIIELCGFALGNSVKDIYYYGTEEDLNNAFIKVPAQYLGDPVIHCLGKNPNSDGSEKGLSPVSFDCKEELGKYTDIAEFDNYLYEAFKNRQEYIDISGFNIPYMDLNLELIEQYVYDYLSYKVECGGPWVNLYSTDEGEYNTYQMLCAGYSYDDIEGSAEFQEKVDYLLQGLKGNSSLSDVQKALIVHDRLIKYLEYDLEAHKTEIEEVIITRKAVCTGYAVAYRYLLGCLNIRSLIVASYELDHAWNIVYIDNVPYYVDCTWDDGGKDVVSHDNFLRSDIGIWETEHSSNDYQPGYSMHNTKYDNYSWRNVYSEIQLIGNELYYKDIKGNLKKFVAEEAEIHIHSYTDSVTKPTCVKQGYTTHTCSCGFSYVDNYTDTIDHNYVSTFVEPKSNAVGYVQYKCKRCGDLLEKFNFVEPTGRPSGFKCVSRTTAAEKFTWNKTAGVTGYQIQISNAAGNKWATAYNAKTATAYTFSKLTAGSNYKFRVRFYITVEGKNYYGEWSTISSPTLPKATNVSLTAAKKAFTAKWGKVAGVTGYQLQYATNAKFSGAKLKSVKGAAKVKLAVKSLKGGAKYFVRVRTFKTIAGKNYYSAWSGAKAVTTKK